MSCKYDLLRTRHVSVRKKKGSTFIYACISVSLSITLILSLIYIPSFYVFALFITAGRDSGRGVR